MTSDNEWDEAHAWVQANSDRLPRTYAEYSTFSFAYRKAIYRRLTPDTKARLWTEHFGHYLDGHPDLSAEQRHVIADAQVLVPEVHRQDRPFDRDKLDALGGRAVAAFGADEAHDLFATLGPPGGSCSIR
ncbi:bacteriocin fulvocin C-related protein [Nonomuraea rhizosphaerae]|uniref:bacteriocin fulvocin C-related protein n=1 Tax=Nonomuraea rhizosphaerae TaxID=2665663 RepID=UPI001C6043B5|nr:bacteriocin fulvocin C-related protein [Nonomuraea rhizosphaerae]